MIERLGRLIKAIPDFLRRHRREAEVLALGVFLSGLGILISLILSQRDNQGIEIVSSGETDTGENSGSRENGQEDLLTDVAGAVIRPGVYRLPAGSRFTDALAAAGGLSSSADRNWVSRHLNLAQNITDGAKIYIPGVGEGTTGTTGAADTTDSINNGSQININSASLTELDGLWGVGEARAKAIIEGRPYASVEELVTRKILPGNVMEKNRPKLAL